MFISAGIYYHAILLILCFCKCNDCWNSNREGKPFTAIIDGANVAYYMQNYEGGSFNFHQIKFMVDALEKMNENPLVILPFKYCSPSFSVGMGSRSKTQMLDNSDKEILNR